jgi:hypothetical protein
MKGKSSMSNMFGYLIWWTVPEVEVPYQDLNTLAAHVGFPPDCVSNPPSPRHADGVIAGAVEDLACFLGATEIDCTDQAPPAWKYVLQ